MLRHISLSFAGIAVLLLVITSCSNSSNKKAATTPEQPTAVIEPDKTASATPSSGSQNPPDSLSARFQDKASGLRGMKTTISKVTALVEKGDFTAASTEFDNFPLFWAKGSEAVKAGSPKTYEAIQSEIEKIKTALKYKQIPQAKLSLEALSTHVEQFFR